MSEQISNRGTQTVLKQLSELQEHCMDMARGGEITWTDDVQAVEVAKLALLENQKFIEKYQTNAKPIQKTMTLYLCPSCHRRVKKNQSHCHRCGKKLGWN